ncbi:MAG: hypothetical protein WC998_05590 [Candidatus Paceibacterota bacterium]|jgi:hypothetical protein
MIVLENGDLIEGDATSASEVDFTIHGLDNNALKQLADGQLANAKGTIFTADSTDVISSIILVNTGAAHNHVNLYLKPSGGTSRRLIAKDLQLESGYSLHFDGAKVMILNTSGQIMGQGVTGAAGTNGANGADGAGAWKQTTGTFTATPASTSTLTMNTDLTASIKAGMSLKYVIGGVTYFGIVGAIASNLLTVWGAPLSGDVTALYYDGGRISQLSYDATVNVDGTANTTALKTGTVYTLKWQKPTSYLVFYQAYQTTHDSHATHGKVTIKINGTEVNTSAGGLVIAANATWYSTVVDIAVAAYDINPGEDLTIVVTQGGTADGAGLAAGAIIITP